MAYTDSEDLNYLGTLFATGNRKTPFLNAIGAPIDDMGNINSAAVKVVTSFEFPVAVPFDTGSGAVPNIDEAASVTGIDAVTITRGQDLQTCQIFMQRAEVSYKKLSTYGTMAMGTPPEGAHNIDGVAMGMSTNIPGNPVMNEMDFQVMGRLRKMATDIDYTIINGVYQGAASVSTAAKMRGIKSAITTNATAAGSVYISQTLINATLKKMVDAGAPMTNLMMVCNSFQRQKVGALYEFVPMSRTEGGSQIQRVYTDFCEFGLLYDPNCPAGEVYFTDMAQLRIVICPVTGKYIIIEEKKTAGASFSKQIYAQVSLDYGPEEYHGKITGLLTS
ncbi:MAG: hypothetical protein EHM20_00065 [Alphaproteobacteria bacterium]|nr:MAG: hypothetical protein EHM20_00065 [Alphaproteobacteria bacterium]